MHAHGALTVAFAVVGVPASAHIGFAGLALHFVGVGQGHALLNLGAGHALLQHGLVAAHRRHRGKAPGRGHTLQGIQPSAVQLLDGV